MQDTKERGPSVPSGSKGLDNTGELAGARQITSLLPLALNVIPVHLVTGYSAVLEGQKLGEDCIKLLCGFFATI